MAKLYTRTGDDGTTSLIDGTRVPKYDIRITVGGDIDELCAHVGLLHTLVTHHDIRLQLHRIQTLLFNCATSISVASAAGGSVLVGHDSQHIGTDDIQWIESLIDTLQRQTPQPHTFVLPGGTTAAAQSHVLRSVARRAERSVAQMACSYNINPQVGRLLNRLADYFFALALHLNFIAQVEEKKLYISCK